MPSPQAEFEPLLTEIQRHVSAVAERIRSKLAHIGPELRENYLRGFADGLHLKPNPEDGIHDLFASIVLHSVSLPSWVREPKLVYEDTQGGYGAVGIAYTVTFAGYAKITDYSDTTP